MEPVDNSEDEGDKSEEKTTDEKDKLIQTLLHTVIAKGMQATRFKRSYE